MNHRIVKIEDRKQVSSLAALANTGRQGYLRFCNILVIYFNEREKALHLFL
jgi:hypothetical protein